MLEACRCELDIRQRHCWLSIIFTAVIAAILVALNMRSEPAYRMYFLAPISLVLLAIASPYAFVLPHAVESRSDRRAETATNECGP
jgi:hypothetical protein